MRKLQPWVVLEWVWSCLRLMGEPRSKVTHGHSGDSGRESTCWGYRMLGTVILKLECVLCGYLYMTLWPPSIEGDGTLSWEMAQRLPSRWEGIDDPLMTTSLAFFNFTSPETEADGSWAREGRSGVPGSAGLPGGAGGSSPRPSGGAVPGGDTEAEWEPGPAWGWDCPALQAQQSDPGDNVQAWSWLSPGESGLARGMSH